MELNDQVTAARKQIFRDGYDISLGELISLYERKELVVQPEYQRLYRWDHTQKTRFIESLLLNIPVPPIFVFSDEGGRWELVDGLQRVSTVLEFMGLLPGESGERKPSLVCDGTALLPALRGVVWPSEDEEQGERSSTHVLPSNLQLSIRRARVRVEILGQETDTNVKYELFQRLNSGGANLSEQELRNCVLVSINRDAFRNVQMMAGNEDLEKLASIGPARKKRQYLLELVIRYLVLRNVEYESGMDVHEYLDRGAVVIASNEAFDWAHESDVFSHMMSLLRDAVGRTAFQKNKRFSLGIYEFVSLGLSKALETRKSAPSNDEIKTLVKKVLNIPETEKYSGIGVRGTQRLSQFVVPLAEKHFEELRD